MLKPRRHFSILILLIALLAAIISPINAKVDAQTRIQVSSMARRAITRNYARLDFYLKNQGAQIGRPVFLRLMRDRGVLELFVADGRGRFRFIRNYRICGTRGTNAANQAPLGIYEISRQSLTPTTDNYLKITTNFPNRYDTARQIRGSLFVQARCSVGQRISLTDTDMDELYTLIYAAINNGQNKIALHIFPFELNTINLMTAKKDQETRIIRQLTPIYLAFERSKRVPNVATTTMGYSINSRR